MISCHSSAGRASQGGHARLTGRSAGSHCWGGELGFHGAAAEAGPAAMNRFNGLCKVCSERRYRQVGAWPLGGRRGVIVGGQGWEFTLAGLLSPQGLLCPVLLLTGSFRSRGSIEAGAGPEVQPLPTTSI